MAAIRRKPKGVSIKFKRRWPLILLFTTAAIVRGNDASSADSEHQDIDALLALSGIQSTVEQIELAYAINLDRQRVAYELTGDQEAVLEQAMQRYRSDQILELLKADLSELLDENSATPVLEILRGDIIQKFRRFERIQSTPQQQKKLADYLPNNPISEQRRSLLRACHLADSGPELSAILQSFAEVDTAVALDYVSGEGISRSDAEGVKLWRRNIEKSYIKQYAVKADPYLAFAYRFLRDEKLEEYAALWNNRNMQWFMQTSLQSLRKILRSQRKPMLENLVDLETMATNTLNTER